MVTTRMARRMARRAVKLALVYTAEQNNVNWRIVARHTSHSNTKILCTTFKIVVLFEISWERV